MTLVSRPAAATMAASARPPAVSRHLAAVAEAAEERFQPEEADERVAGAFDRSQLPRRQLDPIEFPADFRLQRRRQLAAVPGSQRLEPFETISPKRGSRAVSRPGLSAARRGKRSLTYFKFYDFIRRLGNHMNGLAAYFPARRDKPRACRNGNSNSRCFFSSACGHVRCCK
jgi:hypothetical protein